MNQECVPCPSNPMSAMSIGYGHDPAKTWSRPCCDPGFYLESREWALAGHHGSSLRRHRRRPFSVRRGDRDLPSFALADGRSLHSVTGASVRRPRANAGRPVAPGFAAPPRRAPASKNIEFGRLLMKIDQIDVDSHHVLLPKPIETAAENCRSILRSVRRAAGRRPQ